MSGLSAALVAASPAAARSISGAEPLETPSERDPAPLPVAGRG